MRKFNFYSLLISVLCVVLVPLVSADVDGIYEVESRGDGYRSENSILGSSGLLDSDTNNGMVGATMSGIEGGLLTNDIFLLPSIVEESNKGPVTWRRSESNKKRYLIDYFK